VTTQVFPLSLEAIPGQPRHYGAELASRDGFHRLAYTPQRPIVDRTWADVLSIRVEHRNGESVEMLLVSPTPAASFGASSTVARKLVRQDVVMRPGDRLVLELDAHDGPARCCVLGDVFDEQA
jgi:hypothetical protein